MLKAVVAGPRSEIKYPGPTWAIKDVYTGFYEYHELTPEAEAQLRYLAAATYNIEPADLKFSGIIAYQTPRKIGDRGYYSGRLNLSFDDQGQEVQKQWRICQTPGQPACYFFLPEDPADVARFAPYFYLTLRD
jgi:hypothetical protein